MEHNPIAISALRFARTMRLSEESARWCGGGGGDGGGGGGGGGLRAEAAAIIETARKARGSRGGTSTPTPARHVRSHVCLMYSQVAFVEIIVRPQRTRTLSSRRLVSSRRASQSEFSSSDSLIRITS